MSGLGMLGEWWIALRVKGRKGEARREEIIKCWLNTVHWPLNRSVLWGQSMSLTNWLYTSRLLVFTVSQPWWRYWNQIGSLFLQLKDHDVTSTFQRPRDSQRWADTNQNTISQSWRLAVEMKPGRGKHSFLVLMTLNLGHYPKHQAAWEDN